MDFVNDDGVDVAEDVASFRRQDQIERFWSRDENVGRCFCDPSPLARFGVAAADRDGWQLIGEVGVFGRLLDS